MKTQALPFWIMIFLFSIYLLSFSGKLHIMDEFVGFAVGNNLVQHGRADVNQFIWTNHWHSTPPGLWGKDGNLYTKKAPGISLAAAPLIWLGHTLPGLNAVHLGLLLCALITALTGALLFVWLAEGGLSPGVATFTALSYGLCTIALVYARFLWEHSVIALTFLVTFWALYRAVHQPQSRRQPFWILVAGAAMAISLTMRFEMPVAIALVGLYLFLYLDPPLAQWAIQPLLALLKDRKRWIGLGIYAVLPLVTLIWLLYFNFARFGSASETGYNREILFHKPWEGAFGLLFSPSTGLFIYSPLLLLIFWGIRPAWQRWPKPYLGLIIGLTVFYWIFYGSWFSWGSTWVWGPRFMLHTLPLLMLFVAEALSRTRAEPGIGFTRPRLSLAVGLGVGVLAGLGLVINLLGILVDLNEHFLRLGRNDNFVFNWAAFPPLGHWQILQEGLIDLIWVRPQPEGLAIEWRILIYPLILVIVAVAGLSGAYRASTKQARTDFKPYPYSITTHPLAFLLVSLLTLILTYRMMLATAEAGLASPQAQADEPVLQALSTSAQADEVLLVSLPPFGDVQESATHLMAYLDQPLPTYAWIESEPRAIQPEERDRLWQTIQVEAEQAWLFERWLTAADPLSLTAARLGQEAFPLHEQWFERSGKLTLYALAGDRQPALSIPLQAPFQGGITLVEAALFGDKVAPGEVLKVRLTWQAPAVDQLAALDVPEARVIGFVHLVDEQSAQNVAQQDRLLLDRQNSEQAPLQPGQTVTQGYGLLLSPDLPPGAYPLIAGLYPAGSSQRLRRADGSPDDFIYLTTLTVQWGD